MIKQFSSGAGKYPVISYMHSPAFSKQMTFFLIREVNPCLPMYISKAQWMTCQKHGNGKTHERQHAAGT